MTVTAKHVNNPSTNNVKKVNVADYPDNEQRNAELVALDGEHHGKVKHDHDVDADRRFAAKGNEFKDETGATIKKAPHVERAEIGKDRQNAVDIYFGKLNDLCDGATESLKVSGGSRAGYHRSHTIDALENEKNKLITIFENLLNAVKSVDVPGTHELNELHNDAGNSETIQVTA